MAIEEEIEVWDLTHMRILLSMLNRELTDNITFNNHLLSYIHTHNIFHVWTVLIGHSFYVSPVGGRTYIIPTFP